MHCLPRVPRWRVTPVVDCVGACWATAGSSSQQRANIHHSLVPAIAARPDASLPMSTVSFADDSPFSEYFADLYDVHSHGRASPSSVVRSCAVLKHRVGPHNLADAVIPLQQE
jgi:hypothetical protein